MSFITSVLPLCITLIPLVSMHEKPVLYDSPSQHKDFHPIPTTMPTPTAQQVQIEEVWKDPLAGQHPAPQQNLHDSLLEDQGFTDNFIRDREHLQHHLGGAMNLEGATPEELDFHFFKTHDLNGDNLLDGLELLSALIHPLEHTWAKTERDSPGKISEQTVKMWKDQMILRVDGLLSEVDLDLDGYLGYVEYANNRRAKEALKTASQMTALAKEA